MVETTIIGLDIAKQIFQVHGVSADGEITVRRRLRRSEVLGFFGGLARCIVGLEACGGSHFWAREIAAFGHDVRLIPTGLCEALREAWQDGRSRRRGHMRSGSAANDALRPNQVGRMPSCFDGAEDPRSPGPPANPGDQRGSRPSCRARHRRGQKGWPRSRR